MDGFLENFLGARSVAEMSLDVAKQGQVSIVLLARRRNLLGSFERLRIKTFAEISIA